MDKDSKKIIDFICLQIGSKLTELESESQKRDKELTELKERIGQIQELLPNTRRSAVHPPLSSLTLKIDKFLTQEFKHSIPNLSPIEENDTNLQALMSPTNDVKKLKTKTPSFGNLTPPPYNQQQVEEGPSHPSLTEPKPSQKLRSKSQPRGSRSPPRSLSPLPIKNFDQAIKDEHEEAPNEHFARLGENLLLIAEYAGPIFLCLSKRLTSLYIDLKLDLLELLKEQLMDSPTLSLRRSLAFSPETISNLELFEARKGKYFTQAKVSPGEIHVLRLFLCFLGKTTNSINDSAFWKLCQRFLEHKRISTLSEYDLSARTAAEVQKLAALDKVQPVKEYPLLFRPLAKAVLELCQQIRLIPDEDGVKVDAIEQESLALLGLKRILEGKIQ